MNKKTYTQVVIQVSVPVFTCIGCGISIAGTIHKTEIHRRLLNTGLIQSCYIEGVADGSHLTVDYSAPEGWQLIYLPGRLRRSDTDSYCCVNCTTIIQSIIDTALVTAQTAINVNALNVQNALSPPLQGTPVDDRQAVIPHEFLPADDNPEKCDICTLTKIECHANQTTLIG